MRRKSLRTIARTSFALLAMLAAVWQAQAQDSKAPHPSMASLDRYPTGRKAEIAPARSAAAESISPDAEIMVL